MGEEKGIWILLFNFSFKKYLPIISVFQAGTVQGTVDVVAIKEIDLHSIL